MTPALELVLVNWHAAGDCMAHVIACRGWALTSRVWLVDNDGGLANAETRASEHLLSPGANLGFGGGVNFALKRILAQADAAPAILLLNPDVRMDERCVAGLLAQLQAHARMAAIGPRLIETDAFGRERIYCGGRDPARHLNTRVPCGAGAAGAAGGALRDTDYTPGAVMLLSTAAVRETGHFDEIFFFGGETADWCLRARRHGWRVCVDASQRAHHTHDPARARREPADQYYSLRNRLLYCRKHGQRRTLLLWCARYAGIAIRHLLRGRRSLARVTALAVVHGVSGRGNSVKIRMPSQTQNPTIG